MVEAVRKYKRVFQTGSQQRSMAVNRFGCELIRNGRIGKITRVIAAQLSQPLGMCACPPSPCPTGSTGTCGAARPSWCPINIDLCTPRAKPGWISFRPYSGGEMTGWGAHGLDQIQWALGMDESGPVEVWTEGPKFDPPTYTAPESQSRGDKMCSQPEGLLPLSRRHRRWSWTTARRAAAIFIGEKGKITIDRGDVQVRPAEIAKEPIRDGDIQLYKSDNHMRNWLDCIKSRADGRSPTWRSAIARPRSATWATSPAGSAAGCAGTRSRRRSPTTPRPTPTSTACAASPTNCRRRSDACHTHPRLWHGQEIVQQRGIGASVFGHSGFEFVSDFVLRISLAVVPRAYASRRTV